MARWHLALAVFNATQDGDRFRAGERRPVFEASIQDCHDEVLRFSLSVTHKEAGPGGDPVHDRPDICRPDLTRVWAEAARAVAYHLRPGEEPDVTPFQMATRPDARRRRDDWRASLEADFRHEAGQQTLLARDVFGDPFRPVAIDPAWLTADVVGLARAIYDLRAFHDLPVLADALLDAGCGEADVLAHCLGDGPHVRGCWVADLILDRE